MEPYLLLNPPQAHALVARLAAGGSEQLPFPFLCLLVSGGHNLLVLVKGVGHYMQLGTTLDDALGEKPWTNSSSSSSGGPSEQRDSRSKHTTVALLSSKSRQASFCCC